MNAGIFISYRRDDTRQAAGRLADDLSDQLGAERIFRDIEKIELGVDFEQALNQALENCEIMLVLIGRQWLMVADAQGQRRLDHPNDWIRIEIVTALKRGVRVVPVLIDGAPLPSEADLPEDLRPLVRRQALAVEDARWKSDVARLAESLARVGGLARPSSATATAPQPVASVSVPAAASGSMRKGILIGAGAVVAVVAALVIWAQDSIVGTWQTTDEQADYVISKAGEQLQVAFDATDEKRIQTNATFEESKFTFSYAVDAPDGESVTWTCILTLATDKLDGTCGPQDEPGKQSLALKRKAS